MSQRVRAKVRAKSAPGTSGSSTAAARTLRRLVAMALGLGLIGALVATRLAGAYPAGIGASPDPSTASLATTSPATASPQAASTAPPSSDAAVPLLASPAATSADARLGAAADVLEAAIAKGGSGFTFTVVSRSTLNAKPGGPKIAVPDPNDPYTVLGSADTYDLGASIASGVLTPDGYTLQMRRGPATAEEAPDFANAEPTLAALVRDGKTWRNDGEGWYETDQPPGIGLDLATARLLPTLLREAQAPTVIEATAVDGAGDPIVAAVAATGTVADAPGLMAIDAASFTELAAPIAFGFDKDGRLVELHALTRNTRVEDFDLLVDVLITLAYDVPPDALPEPSPLWSPKAGEGVNP